MNPFSDPFNQPIQPGSQAPGDAALPGQTAEPAIPADADPAAALPGAPAGTQHPGRSRPRLRSLLSPLVAVAVVSGLVASGTTLAVETVALSHAQSPTAASGNVAGVTLLSSTSGSLASLVAKTTQSVVTINVTGSAGYFGQQVSGVGTGLIVGSDGLILTNAHVVSGASSIQVTLPSGQTVAGTVYGVSSTTDLAIVKVNATGLTVATLGDSNSLQVGQTVVAIGDPLGQFTDSATAGIVSGLNRTITVENETLTGLVQTDAAVNGGNSGGPLIDSSGNVVAIVTASSSNAQGISFAIPIAAATSMISAALAGQPIA
jgi:S1-C subfamily serine protease